MHLSDDDEDEDDDEEEEQYPSDDDEEEPEDDGTCCSYFAIVFLGQGPIRVVDTKNGTGRWDGNYDATAACTIH